VRRSDARPGATPGTEPSDPLLNAATSRWSPTPGEARGLQVELRASLDLRPLPGFRPRLIGGADVSATRRSPLVTGGFSVIDLETLAEVDRAVATLPATFPYVPGLLSFRELPVLQAAWERLAVRPEVIVFDGHGLAHPRRFGLACHGGVVFGVPSLGCAKSILVGTHPDLPLTRGSVVPLEDAGEVVGAVVRTRTGVKPVIVSPGHRVDVPTAVDLVLRLTPRFRQPETTRRAHRLVNDARAAVEDPRNGG
jgi:deoxyribonuclease V